MSKHLAILKATGLLLVSAFVLAGCAVGQKYEYSNVPIPLSKIESKTSVAVGVKDARPYIVSGDKPQTFVGLQRGSFNNPFDINTQSGNPLAIDLRDDIVKALQNRGMTVIPVTLNPTDSADKVKNLLISTHAKKLVLVTINEWKSNAGFRTGLRYNVNLTVINSQGTQLATNQIAGNDNLGRYVLPHSSGTAVTKFFPLQLEKLFDDSKIVAALK